MGLRSAVRKLFAPRVNPGRRDLIRGLLLGTAGTVVLGASGEAAGVGDAVEAPRKRPQRTQKLLLGFNVPPYLQHNRGGEATVVVPVAGTLRRIILTSGGDWQGGACYVSLSVGDKHLTGAPHDWWIPSESFPEGDPDGHNGHYSPTEEGKKWVRQSMAVELLGNTYFNLDLEVGDVVKVTLFNRDCKHIDVTGTVEMDTEEAA